MTNTRPIRIHVDPGVPPAVSAAFRESSRVETADLRDAVVWVVPGDRPPPRMPERRPAVLVVGREQEAEAGWLEASVDLWVSLEELLAGCADALERALVTRRVLRPSATDTAGIWLDALRSLTRSDAVAWIDGGRIQHSGDDPAFDAIWSTSSLVTSAARSAVAVSSADGVISRFGVSSPVIDGLIALPMGTRGSDGVLILVVREHGESWIRSSLALARAATESAERLSLQRRLSAAEAEQRRLHGAMSRFVAMVSHDLRSPLFAIQLGVKVLERQGGPSPSLAVLSRAVTSASDLLRRLVEAGRAVLDPPKRLTGTADLAQVWSRVRAEVVAQHPTGVIEDSGPGSAPLRVAVDAPNLELLVRTLLVNAVVHGAAGSPVQAAFSVEPGSVSVRITNVGSLPFTNLAALEPFEHRSNGGLGAALFNARNVAAAAGVELRLVQQDTRVEATMVVPLAQDA